jgi:hypothetical protein
VVGEKYTVSKLKSHFWEYSEDEGSFGGLFGLNIRLIIFSGLIGPKKEVFQTHDLTSIICTITFVIYHVDIFNLHATVFGSLFPILRDLDSRLGSCRVRGIDYLFFEVCLKK